MDENAWWKSLRDRLKFFAMVAACVLIDSALLFVWVATQWAVEEQVISRLRVSGITLWVVLAFQIIFAGSTLITVMVYFYMDL
ncbi:MAG: hypothetical protein ABIH46_08650, partial [Chloroflexota bacterium]